MNGEEKIITVFVAASSAIARAGLKAILGDDADIIIAGRAVDVLSAPPTFYTPGEKDYTNYLTLEETRAA